MALPKPRLQETKIPYGFLMSGVFPLWKDKHHRIDKTSMKTTLPSGNLT